MLTARRLGFRHLSNCIRLLLGCAALVLSLECSKAVTMASSPDPRAFEPAPGTTANGYVSYAIPLWGAKAAGHFTSAEVDEYSRLVLRSENGDDGRVDAPTVDGPVRSLILLPVAFRPSHKLLTLRVQRPVAFTLGPPPRVPLTLRRLGPDPSDASYDVYETQLAGFVLSGTITAFMLDDRIVQRGYPYIGPFSFSGPYSVRPAAFTGEKSIIRIPTNATIPEILFQRR